MTDRNIVRMVNELEKRNLDVKPIWKLHPGQCGWDFSGGGGINKIPYPSVYRVRRYPMCT